MSNPTNPHIQLKTRDKHMDIIDATRWVFTTKHIVFTREGSQQLPSGLLDLEMLKDKPVNSQKEYWWFWQLLIGTMRRRPEFMGALILQTRHKYPTAVFREVFVVRNHFMHAGLAVFGGDGDAHIEFWPAHIDTTPTE